MKEKVAHQNSPPKNIDYLNNTLNGWAPLTFIHIISLMGFDLIKYQTCIDCKLIFGFMDSKGKTMINQLENQVVESIFLTNAIMEYGCFWENAPPLGYDFTAKLMHGILKNKVDFSIDKYDKENRQFLAELQGSRIDEFVQIELKPLVI